MKTNLRSFLMSGLIMSGLLMTTSCEKDPMNGSATQYASVIEVAADGSTSAIEANIKSAMVETSVLSETELSILLKMKEEEKLARDVYSALYEKWGNTIFSRISIAEDNHLNAIILLLKNYNSSDTLIAETGVFSNAEIQSLYNDLITKAAISVEEALKTGALIEEMDIKDLTESLSSTSNANITLVFENLLKGSRNHLRAFNKQLTILGSIYVPVYISQADYDQIVNSPMEKGKQYKMQGNGQNKGNCNGNGQGSGNGKGNGNGTGMHRNG
jgi:hypothetical protein